MKKPAIRPPDTLPVSVLAGMAAPYNPRTIEPDEMEALKRSLKFFGAVQPIVVNTRSQRIVGGHQRVVAAAALEMKELPVVYVDLDDPSEKQLNLALNRISGAWDEAKLAEVMRSLQESGADMALTGFTDEEIREYLGQVQNPTDEAEEDAGGPPLPRTAITKPGDIWTLGDHRILCGSATDLDDIAKLLAGVKPVLMNTDPPWGVDYVATKTGIPGTGFQNVGQRYENIQGDGEDNQAMMDAWVPTIRPTMATGAAIYVWGATVGEAAERFLRMLREADMVIHRTVVWIKPNFTLSRSGMYHWQHETALYGWFQGDQPAWLVPKDQGTTWPIAREPNQNHPTAKPVELFARPIRNHTRQGDAIYEPFSGSGAQIIAAEQLQRRCFAIDIDPRYVDVAVERWQAFTGGKAKRG